LTYSRCAHNFFKRENQDIETVCYMPLILIKCEDNALAITFNVKVDLLEFL